MITYCSGILIIGLCACQYGFKRLPNIWMPILLALIVFSSLHSPNISFESTFLPHDAGVFNFKPLFECILYFFMFMAVYSLPLTSIDKTKIYKVMAWTAVIYSGYICLQHLGFDQIYKITDQMEYSQMSRNPESGGFLSQPVYAAALLVLFLPFVLRYMYKFLPIVLLAIFFTGNRSVLAAVAILSLYLFFGSRRLVLTTIMAYMAILALIMSIYLTYHWQITLFDDHGRFEAWKAIFLDFLHPHFPGISKTYILTGLGIGAFPVIFPFYNHSPFFQAHNEFLECLYGLSIGGLALFLAMMKDIFDHINNDYVFLSLTGICICAFTEPVWHTPQLQFLTVFLAALAYNKETHNVGIVNKQ